MSLSRLDFYSEVLSMDQTVYVTLPDKGELAPAEPLPPENGYPVLYLLHGTSHDCSHWLRYTGIERYSTDRKVAVVMPSAQLSGYADMVHGEAFFRYLTEELPKIINDHYCVSSRREDTFVAGVSMAARPMPYGRFVDRCALLDHYKGCRNHAAIVAAVGIDAD